MCLDGLVGHACNINGPDSGGWASCTIHLCNPVELINPSPVHDQTSRGAFLSDGTEKRTITATKARNHVEMATVAESSSEEEKPNVAPHSDIFSQSKALEEATPWIEYAVQQAALYQKIAKETIDSTIEASRSRLSEIGLTASAHFQQTIVKLLEPLSSAVILICLAFRILD